MNKRLCALVGITLTATVLLVPSKVLARSPKVDRVIQNRIQNYMDRNSVPGVAVGLYCQGQSSQYHFGMADQSRNIPVTDQTIFELASVSKVLTSTLLAWEVKQGHLGLENSISNVLKELPPGSGRPVDQITLLNLATHTASLPLQGGSNLGMNNRQLMQMLDQWQPPYPIGTQISYSNFGFGLLGQVLEDSSLKSYGKAMTFEEMVQSWIVGPLQMPDTSVSVATDKQGRYAQGYNRQGDEAPHYSEHPVWAGGGGFRSTIQDMTHFLEANLGVYQRSSADQLMDSMAFAQTPVQVNREISAALGWEVRHTQPKVIAKNGSNQGFSSFIAFVPARRLGIVILTNKSAAKPARVANGILQALLANRACD